MKRIGAIAAAVATIAAAAPSLAVEAPVSLAAGAANAQRPAHSLPSDPDELLAYVTHALNVHDLDAFDRLVEWEGNPSHSPPNDPVPDPVQFRPSDQVGDG